eukprot:3547740-Heterocapsa_arctica.AAC.1
MLAQAVKPRRRTAAKHAAAAAAPAPEHQGPEGSGAHRTHCPFGRRPWKILAGIGQFESGRPRYHHSIPHKTLIILHNI